VGERHDGLGGADRADPCRVVSPGVKWLTMACSSARLALSARPASRSTRTSRQISDWRTACCRLASRGWRRRDSPARVVSVKRAQAAAPVAWRTTANGDADRRAHRDGDDDGALRAREPGRPT
jgi:hypothetical protein